MKNKIHIFYSFFLKTILISIFLISFLIKNVSGQNFLEEGLNNSNNQLLDILNELSNSNNNFNNLSNSNNQNNFNTKEFLDSLEKNKNFNSEYETQIEIFYSDKAGTELRQNGYELFEYNKILEYDQNFFSGGIDDNYILGFDDEISIYLYGGVNKTYNIIINSQGILNLEFSAPILAYGKSLGELKKIINQVVKNTYNETNVFISIGKLKNIFVMVTGEVLKPGIISLNSQSSAIDALRMTGGIKKSGTLRNIKVINGTKSYTLDLYSYLYGYGDLDKQLILKDGSIVVVPPIGKTVALSGAFANPGIYETKGESEKISDAIEFAGGYGVPGSLSIIKRSINSFGDGVFSEVKRFSENLNNGDIIFAYPKGSNSSSAIKVTGAVLFEGFFPYEKYNSLEKIFYNTEFLKDNAYKLSIAIKNKKNNNFSSYKMISLQNILNGVKKYKLNPGDEIHVYSWDEINFLSSKNFIDAIFNKIDQKPACESHLFIRDKFYQNNKQNKKLKNIYTEYFSFVYSSDETSYKKTNFEKDFVNNELELEENILRKQKTLNETNKSLLNNLEKNSINELCDSVYEKNIDLLNSTLDNIFLLKGNYDDKSGIFVGHENLDVMSISNYFNLPNKNIFISPDASIFEIEQEEVFLKGAVRFESSVKYKKGINLKNIIGENHLLTNITYPFFGIVERINKQNGLKKFITFSPTAIIKSDLLLPLKPGDEIILFSEKDINQHLNFLKNHNSESLQNTSADDSYLKDNIVPNNIVPDNISNRMMTKKLENDSYVSLKKENKIYNNQDTFSLDDKDKSFTLHNKIISQKLVELQGNIIMPGLYPLGSETLLEDLISYAGGYTYDANEGVFEIINGSEKKTKEGYISAGSSVFVPSNNYKNNKISIMGEINNPRSIGLDIQLKLSDVITNKNIFTKKTYPYFATIKRFTASEGIRYYPFSPNSILDGEQDFNLFSRDEIIFYSYSEIEKFVNKINDMPEMMKPEVFGKASLTKTLSSGNLLELIGRLIYRVEGSIVNSGNYLLSGSFTIKKLIDISGGLRNDASKKAILIQPYKDELGNIILNQNEIVFTDDKFTSLVLSPGSVIRIPEVLSEFERGFVEISGAVSQPGSYRILKNDTLFSLIKRAGGLKENAFLKGLIFTRTEEKDREKASINRLKRELDRSLSSALKIQDAENQSIDASTINALKKLSEETDNIEPIGRLVGDFDTIYILKSTKIKSGDKVFIPIKPTSITMAGEVMTPGSILWESNKDIKFYISSAAGFTELADKRKVFVIYPNGKAKRQSGLWASKENIFPGSTIVIPRKIDLSSSLGKISAVTSVFYQLTLTLAGIDNLLNN